MNIENKIHNLEDFLKNKKCILCFSAGSDSTLLAFILSKVSPDSLLVTVDNNMMPEGFLDFTIKQAEQFNLKHEIIKIDFLKNDIFINNNKNRCYECRYLMYENIQKLSYFKEYDYFIEGTNITDLIEDRPGILVLDTYNMISPLIECNITKDDVYAMIDYLNLEYSDDTTCLATRIKTDQKVDLNKLKLVSESEKIVKSLINQKNVRVRCDDSTAVVSVDEPLKILDKKIIQKIKLKLVELGFKKVFLDITGYEKSELKYSVDEKGNYYYRLPYEIDLEKTRNNFEYNKKFNENIKFDGYLSYNDILIEKNGKISMPPTKEFNNKFNNVLSLIKRKEI